MSNDLYRLTRNLGQQKGSKVKISKYPPVNSEGKDGDIQVVNSHLYIKNNNTWAHFIPASTFGINKLINNTGGTVSNTLVDAAGGTYPTDEEFVNAIASLTVKINEIINKLGLEKK